MGKRKKTFPLRRIVLLVVALVIISGAVWWALKPRNAIDDLQQRGRVLPTLALANSALKPPTNKWFSSLAFKQPSDPVFAYPLAMQTTTTGFDLSYPRITVSTNTIDASFKRDIGLNFGPNTKSYVSNYDDLSVELQIRNNDTVRATARMTQGSPYIFMQLKSGAQLTLDADAYTAAANFITLRHGDQVYEVYLGGGATYSEITHVVTADRDILMSVYVVPQDANVTELRAGAQNPITSTKVDYKIDGKTAQTTFAITTLNNKPTVYSLLPDQMQGTAAPLGHFTTLLGIQTLVQGNSFTFATPLPDMPSALPVEKLSSDQKAQLTQMVKDDATNVTFTATDTYGAGKELYKTANLLQLAQQLGLRDQATSIKQALRTELTQWFDPNTGNQRNDKYFYYDTTIKGIIGEKTSFGSEDFNDHHFHYGYMLYAAAVLGQYDDVFVNQYGAQVTLLAHDIANPNRNDPDLPYVRVFDQYAGHSWASGFAPFGAGNNQESSSEAVNAWYGMYRWAQISGDNPLSTEAQWLFARESNAALQDYLNFDQSRPEYTGYAHSVISLLWSGKADYATFFDAAPESKLAIQLIPINPAANYLGVDKTRAALNLANVVRETGQAPSKFKDYLIMYQVFSDPKGALASAANLHDADIDSANSRSYLFAWLFTHQ